MIAVIATPIIVAKSIAQQANQHAGRNELAPALAGRQGSLGSGFDKPQVKVFCDQREIPVVVQQLALIFQCSSGNDAVIGLADGNALLAQLAVYLCRSNKYGFRHGQHDQWTKITPDTLVIGVVSDALKYFS